jgi:hypothetical protein
MNDLAAGVATTLLLASVCLLMPLGLSLVAPGGGVQARLRAAARRLHWLAAAALVIAFVLPVGYFAGALCLPWLATTVLLAAAALARLCGAQRRDLATLGESAALAFPAVGAGWALCARAGIAPLDFSPAIALLTAVHFHHAGFTLPLSAALMLRRAPSMAARLAVPAVVAGMPLTAIGITATQLGAPPDLELALVAVTTAAGLLAAAALALAAAEPTLPTIARRFAAIAAAALTLGMSLAFVYGCRRHLPFIADEPRLLGFMVGSHGILNGAVFGPCALLACRTATRQPIPAS